MNKSDKPDYIKIVGVGIPLTFILWGATFLLLTRLTHAPSMSKYVAVVIAAVFLPVYLYFSIKYADKLDASKKQKTDEDNANIVLKDRQRKITIPMLRFGATIASVVMTLSAFQKIGNVKMIIVLFGISLTIVFPLCYFAWKYRSWIANTKKGIVLAPLSIPIGLLFWKWIGSVSVAVEHISIFVAVLLFSFIVFFFEKENIKI